MIERMGPIKVTPLNDFSHAFVQGQYLPDGEDEYYLRNRQLGRPAGDFRRLKAEEIEVLVKNGNNAESWDTILVADPFRAKSINNCEFAGLVRIGKLEKVVLTHHDLHVPAGLSHSRIINCDIGDNAAVHQVGYLSHYILGENCILQSIDEMHTSDYAKFGNGIVKQGEDEKVRIWLDLMNEAGGRSVLPFDGITPADAYLWAKYRGDKELMDKLKQITQQTFDDRRGYYGTVGRQSVIKTCRIIKDCKVGEAAYIKGANKLKNLTIHSSFEERTQIGEGVELVNGIIGYGCRIFYGCKAVRFVMGDNSALKYGARLIHSILGDNSTVSCCELLNNLIFPAHEQHHNNSFLVAALVMGQSNMAAGATIGSNHNSRANDGELVAGRGFWPGLCTTLKHSSKFASYCLLVKGDYPAELNIRLPFTLVSNDEHHDRLNLVPGFWWTHDMYALARNAWKYGQRDKRKRKTQHVEFEALAPDTVEEIFSALDWLEQNTDGGAGEATIPPGTFEQGRREAVLRNPGRAIKAYRQMLMHYAMSNLLGYLESKGDAGVDALVALDALSGKPRVTTWTNLGGQLVPSADVDALRADIREGKLNAWDAIHARYDELWQAYPLAKTRHAYATLLSILGTDKLTAQRWADALGQARDIQRYIREQVRATRAKDFDNPFRAATFDSDEERAAVVGTIEDNDFVKLVNDETAAYEAVIEKYLEQPAVK